MLDWNYLGMKLWKKILEKNPGYTQREWDRIVGYGKVPKEYERKE